MCVANARTSTHIIHIYIQINGFLALKRLILIDNVATKELLLKRLILIDYVTHYAIIYVMVQLMSFAIGPSSPPFVYINRYH